MQCNKWDRHFLEMCFQISKMSKDPSTKCGSLIVKPNKIVVSQGYNGFPKQMKDDPELYNNRETKLSRVVHAELNAIIHACQNLEGCTLYSTPSLSCDRCAVSAIQAGIKRLVGPAPYGDFGTRWGDMIKKTKSYCEESGVSYTEVNIDTWEVVTNHQPQIKLKDIIWGCMGD